MELVAAKKTDTRAWSILSRNKPVLGFMDRSVTNPINEGIFEVTRKIWDKHGRPVWFLKPVLQENFELLRWLVDKSNNLSELETKHIWEAVFDDRLTDPIPLNDREQQFLEWALLCGAENLCQVINVTQK